MHLLLIISILILPFKLAVAECLVVSGLKHDFNSAFRNKKSLVPETSVVAGKPCKVFDSWKELNDYVVQSKIPSGSELLIMQGAHGIKQENSDEVYFECNAESPTAETILNHLENLSGKYKVGAVIHSCYSGELMRRKLTNDYLQPKSLDSLCLITSSSPGRIAFARNTDPMSLIENAKQGTSLEDIFLKTDAGMISSAAWNEIDLPKYLTEKTVDNGYKTMMNMDKIVRRPGSCENIGEINSILCSSPGITDEIFEDLKAFMDPLVPDELRGYFVTNMTIKNNLIIKQLSAAPDNKALQAAHRCTQGILQSYEKKFGKNLVDLTHWSDVEEIVSDLQKADFNKDCEAYKATLKEQWHIDSLYTESFFHGFKEYNQAVDRLQRKYTKRKFDEKFNLYDFAIAAAGEKKACNPESKLQIIQSLFGDDFFQGEYFTNFKGTLNTPGETVVGHNVSTQHLMKAFQNASLLKKDMPDSADAQRRKACRDFTL
jgi:hypothetical protein